MRHLILLLILSTGLGVSLKYLKGIKKTNKGGDFCYIVHKSPKQAFTKLLEYLYSDGSVIQVAGNIDKINCYLKYLKTKSYIDAIDFLNKLIKLTDNTTEQDLLLSKVRKIIDAHNIQVLYIAVSSFRKRYDRFPRDLNELVIHGFIEEIPQNPYGGQYYIDLMGRIKRTRDDKVK